MERVFAIIPAYNEGKTIEEVLIETKKYVDGIVVVDDCSEDDTVSIVKKHSVCLIRHRFNRGKGAAIRTGFDKAKKMGATIVAIVDADYEHDPANIPKLVNGMKEKDANMVIGARGIMRSGRRAFLNRFVNFCINMVVDYGLTDTQSGFKILTVDAFEKLNLKTSRYEVETEFILEARRNKMKVIEVPVEMKKYTNSKYSIEHMIQNDLFFDYWVLNWVLFGGCDLSIPRKIFVSAGCLTGIILFNFIKLILSLRFWKD